MGEELIFPGRELAIPSCNAADSLFIHCLTEGRMHRVRIPLSAAAEGNHSTTQEVKQPSHSDGIN